MPRDFTDLMAAGRENALRRRNREQATGKSAKGWNVQPATLDPRNWDHVLIVVRQRWRSARRQIVSDYRAAALNYRHKDQFDEIPF